MPNLTANHRGTVILWWTVRGFHSKNRQQVYWELHVFLFVVNALCHLFAGMCPPCVDMGNLLSCDPQLGLKAYGPLKRTQFPTDLRLEHTSLDLGKDTVMDPFSGTLYFLFSFWNVRWITALFLRHYAHTCYFSTCAGGASLTCPTQKKPHTSEYSVWLLESEESCWCQRWCWQRRNLTETILLSFFVFVLGGHVSQSRELTHIRHICVSLPLWFNELSSRFMHAAAGSCGNLVPNSCF